MNICNLHSLGAGLLSATPAFARRVALALFFLDTGLVCGQSAVDGFDPNANGFVRVVVVQPDGKILIGGDFTTLSPNGGAAVTRNHIARLNPDGTLDTAFDPNANTSVFSIAVQADGKVLAGGAFIAIGGQVRTRIARLDATTGLADSFNPSSNLFVNSIAVQADGKILAGGSFNGANSIGGQTRNRIARLDPTTGLADSWDPNANNTVLSIVVQADGKILAGGAFSGASSIGGQTRNRIARLDATTGLADSWDPNVGGLVVSIAVQPSGKILAGGSFNGANSIGGQTRNRIARLDATTGLADSFDPNANLDVNSIAVQADGKILAGGDFNTGNCIGGQARNYFARLDATTGLADSFNAKPDGLVNSIAVQADGKILVGGAFTTFAPNGGAAVTRHAIARLFQPTPPVIISPLTVTGTVGLPFIYQFEASGATSLAANNLAPGLTFNASLGAIIGTPTAAGTFPVGLSATNTVGTTTGTLTLTVQSAPASGPVLINGTSATLRVGQRFSFHVTTTHGTPGARVSASGLPAGLSIDAVTGLISGTPTVAGSSAVTLTVTDGAFTTSAIVQVTVIADPALPVIVSPSSTFLTPGQFFSYTIVTSPAFNPSDPTIFTLIGTLPAGLSFDAATGTVSGTYTGPLRESASGGPPKPDLAGGALLGSIQLFATNSHGTSTFQLLFLVAPSGAVNIATRLLVGTSENVLIGGFIITGNAPKTVIIRAIGPSTGIPGALQDPTLELHDGAGHIVLNDNWKTAQEQIIRDTGLQPSDDRESAIVIGLDPGNYTAIVAGKDGTAGIGLVEAYDLGTASLDTSGAAKLANIATRGFVNTGDNVMIGGVILASHATRVIVRAIGPSLIQFGIANALPNPTLELHDGSGALIFSNDDWRSTQEQEIIGTGLMPTNDRESAIVATLVPGNYTAIVRGTDNTTGVAIVEAYNLQ